MESKGNNRNVLEFSYELDNKDFTSLQKVLLTTFQINGTLSFVLKYVMNFLYGLLAFIATFFLSQSYFGQPNLILALAAGVLVFALLLVNHRKLMVRRMNKIIDRYYRGQNLVRHRSVKMDEAGIDVTEEGRDKEYFAWDDFEKVIQDQHTYFFKLKNKEEGFILKVNNLSSAQREEVKHRIEAKTKLNDLIK